MDATAPSYYPTGHSNTALADLGAGIDEPVSSGSQPSFMIRMVEALDLRDGQRVLEIGTGTGYNAALLSHRLGETNVFSADVDASLVAMAADRLAAIGYRPTFTIADGVSGLPAHAPFNAIIATCSVPVIPATTRTQSVWLDEPETRPFPSNYIP